jgi:hypothetical protein
VLVTCKWLCLAFTYSGRFQAGKRIGATRLVSVPCGRGRSGRARRAPPGGLDAVGIGFPPPDVVEVGLTVQRARDRLGYAWPVASLSGIQDRRQFLDEGVRGVRRFVGRPATRGRAVGPEPILKIGGRADAELAQDIAVGRLLLEAVLASLAAHVEEQVGLVDPIDQSIDRNAGAQDDVQRLPASDRVPGGRKLIMSRIVGFPAPRASTLNGGNSPAPALTPLGVPLLLEAFSRRQR